MDKDQELHILHKAISGQDLEEIKDPEFILNMLREGKSDIITNLKWGEKREEEFHDIHKIVLQELKGDRVVFYNPLGHSEDMKEGTVIKGEYKGPERRVEGTGLESVSIEEFIKFFEKREGVSYFPIPH